MCGFAGVVAWADPYRISRQVLDRMSGAVAHRGPDGQGVYISHDGEPSVAAPQVALAHRRLAIIDLDRRADQPFRDDQGRWIVFNGEIYNYRELRRELAGLRPGYQWRTQSDTEVLLAAYAQWGGRCVERLEGMFAFGVWDPADGSLFLARDRMGQKPLYIACVGPGGRPLRTPLEADGALAVAFASELRPLRALPWVDQSLDLEALAGYLSLGYILEGTIYRGVCKLPPATSVRISAASVHQECYFRGWDDTAGPGCPDTRTGARVRQLVLEAVRGQMVADVPVGCFLSGGTDSSVIAAAMKKAAGDNQSVLTFSIGFDDPRYDETRYAEAVARHLGTYHRCFKVRPNAAEDLPRLAAVFGEPFADSSALPTHYLAREARCHVKAALSGDGGDELFGGYDRYRALALTERLAGWPAPFRRALARIARRVLPQGHPKSALARARRLLTSVDLGPAQRYAGYMRLFGPEEVCRLLRVPELAAAGSPDCLESLFARGLQSRPAVPTALAVDRVTYLPEDLFTKVDRASMLHGLEVRSPFMDRQLLLFAAGLTTDQLLKGGRKPLLREAFAGDLPRFVFRRAKMGFALPIGQWLCNELRPMLHDLVFARDSFASEYFNMGMVRRLVEEHQQLRVDHSQRLYALLMLELWWRTPAP